MRNKGERQRSVVAEPGFQYKFRGGGYEGDTVRAQGVSSKQLECRR